MKNCPFCGNPQPDQPRFSVHPPDPPSPPVRRDLTSVQCMSCYAEGPRSSGGPNGATVGWEDRVPEPLPPGSVMAVVSDDPLCDHDERLLAALRVAIRDQYDLTDAKTQVGHITWVRTSGGSTLSIMMEAAGDEE